MMLPTLEALLRRGLLEGHDTLWITADGETVSRAQFRAMVTAARAALAHHGDPLGRRIALHGTVTPALLACLIAALLDGAVVVPLDAELPELRKRTMVELAAARVVLDFAGGASAFAPDAEVIDARGGWLDTAATSSVETSSVGAGVELAGSGSVEARAQGTGIEGDAACYVFFTSGTTGTPKGVLGRRSGLAHFLAWEVGMLGVGPGARVSVLTRLSFDVVLRDLLVPIVGGATGCIAPRQLGPAAMLAWLDERAVTISHVVPSLAKTFLAAAPAGFSGRALRHTLFAGEPLSSVLVGRWRAAFPDAAIYNLYGPTETTLAKFCARIPAVPDDGMQPCGYPLPETEAIILDDHGGRAAPGETGEVAIATRHRSLGYLDPVQTRERFVRAAAHDVYLTGDLGFLAPDGQLHLRGRRDDQVKILGVRIELAGVAAVIQGCPGVGDAAVIVVDDGDDGDDRRLIGYFTTTRADAPGALAQRLRPYLSERLPPAAIPGQLIELPAMPLTSNGKLDRARLPRPERSASVEPAADPVECAVIEAFASALPRTAEIGALDDFFALGGDSLAAAGVCEAIRRSLDGYVAPADLLAAPTPRALAARLRATGALRPSPIPRAPVTHHFALTPQQRRYFRTFCAGGNRSWCNMVAVLALPAETSRAAVEDALADIAARHDSLRLAFSFDDSGQIRQAIDFRWDPVVTEVDLEALAPDAVQAALGELRVREGEQAIPPLRDGPLFRAQLVKLAAGERRLVWTVHHLISDGTSQGILARELLAVLAGQRPSEAERFAAPSFVDVAAWAMVRPGLDAARAYFQSLFARPYRHAYLPATQPVDDPQRCLSLDQALPAAVRERARALARSHRTTPYVVLLAGYVRLMAQRTGAADLAILTPLAGREHPQVAPLIGDFINLVPLRIANAGAAAAALIDGVKHQVREAARHQAFQLDELVDDLGLPLDPDRNPLSGLSLNFMPQAGRMPAVSGRVSDKGYKLKYDVLFLVRDYEDATAVEIQFRAGLLDAAGAAALFADYAACVEGLGHD